MMKRLLHDLAVWARRRDAVRPVPLALALVGWLLVGGPAQAKKCEDYPEGHPVRQSPMCQSQLPAKSGGGFLFDIINLPNTVVKDAADAARGKSGKARTEPVSEPGGEGAVPEDAETERAEAESERARRALEEERRRLEDLRREIERERQALEDERKRTEAEAEHQRAEESQHVLEEARRLVEEVKRKAAEEAARHVVPGRVFRDSLHSGGEGPQMMVLPAGNFRMGTTAERMCSEDDDAYCVDVSSDDREKPAHEVRIAHPFAVSVYEVTYGDYGRFDPSVTSGGIRDYLEAVHSGTYEDIPMAYVTWQSAKKYVAWLSSQTGKEYRLLSEAEWEYAARAGTTTAFSWGDEFPHNRAHCCGGDGWRRPMPVGSYEPNGFGLYDMHGNVPEWVEDCWNDNYRGAPDDGSAWMQGSAWVMEMGRGTCALRVVRGGSWDHRRHAVRSASRSSRHGPDTRHDDCCGFRVARTLTP